MLQSIRRRIAAAFAPETKASATARVLGLYGPGQPVWTPRDYAALAREGYGRNAVAYRCVRLIAEAAASVPWLLYEDGRELEAHPLLDLLARPNPLQSGPELMERWYGFLQVAGNAYLEVVEVDGVARELHALRPDRMRVVPGASGWPAAYDYGVGGETVRFTVDPDRGVMPILHMRLFHPTHDHYGMSPLEAAAHAIDIHNAAAAWNKALIDNGARPSGALIYRGADGGALGEDQFHRLKEELEQGFQGARNAGRPLLLEGGLEWAPMSLSPAEMDFREARHAAAREIALAFGVPPMLLGIPGDNTYANFREANMSFWRQTVLPLVGKTAQALARWLGPRFGRRLRLGYDADAVEALSPEREALWARLGRADFLTTDEKRAAVGYGQAESAE
jgi:HK97 family phage portal protein